MKMFVFRNAQFSGYLIFLDIFFGKNIFQKNNNKLLKSPKVIFFPNLFYLLVSLLVRWRIKKIAEFKARSSAGRKRLSEVMNESDDLAVQELVIEEGSIMMEIEDPTEQQNASRGSQKNDQVSFFFSSDLDDEKNKKSLAHS